MGNDAGKLCLLVCSYFEREAQIILQEAGQEDVTMQVHIPVCSHPRQEAAVCEQAAGAGADENCEVVLVGGCFLSAGQEAPCRVHRLELCFYLLASRELIDEQLKSGAYLLTPGWLAGWRTQLEQWGFDRATAGAFFKECASSLVLLDTGSDTDSTRLLTEFAGYLDLPYRVIPVGLEHMRLVFVQIILEWRLACARSEQREITEQTRRKIADQAMALDLLVGLTKIRSEEEAINHILNLFAMLFAPGQIVYAAVMNGRVESTYTYPLAPIDTAQCQAWLDENRNENTWTDAEQGFYLRLSYQDQTLGLLEVSAVAFPDHRLEYLNIVLPISQLCALAVANTRMFQEVRQLASTDSLTGLYNRRHFFSEAVSEFARAGRYRRLLSVLMLDIDFFKAVNDRYGHMTGDLVLTEVARCCQQVLRTSDLCGRYGGEEFVFLLPETSGEAAGQVAERLRRSIEQLKIRVEEQPVPVTASLGLAVLEDDCTTLEMLLDRSDQALYAAKKSGRNKVCVWMRK